MFGLNTFTNSSKSGFNLTASYRRDSDVTRIWGSGQNTIDLLRWDKKNEKFISYEDHINEIMSRKSKERLSSKQEKLKTIFNRIKVWFVSNCNNTNGARERWKYGQSLINAGLSLTGYG